MLDTGCWILDVGGLPDSKQQAWLDTWFLILDVEEGTAILNLQL